MVSPTQLCWRYLSLPLRRHISVPKYHTIVYHKASDLSTLPMVILSSSWPLTLPPLSTVVAEPLVLVGVVKTEGQVVAMEGPLVVVAPPPPGVTGARVVGPCVGNVWVCTAALVVVVVGRWVVVVVVVVLVVVVGSSVVVVVVVGVVVVGVVVVGVVVVVGGGVVVVVVVVVVIGMGNSVQRENNEHRWLIFGAISF